MINDIECVLSTKLGTAISILKDYYTEDELQNKKKRLWAKWNNMSYDELNKVIYTDESEFTYMVEIF